MESSGIPRRRTWLIAPACPGASDEELTQGLESDFSIREAKAELGVGVQRGQTWPWEKFVGSTLGITKFKRGSRKRGLGRAPDLHTIDPGLILEHRARSNC